jgi:hypothetical protein
MSTIDQSEQSRTSIWLLTACAVWLVGLGTYFIALRPALLPEDPRFMGATLEQLRKAAPGLESWLRIVFTVMGGYMVGTGVLTLFVARVAMPQRLAGTAWALGLTGLSTVILMSTMNFVPHSDFRWILLIPALLWGRDFLPMSGEAGERIGPSARTNARSKSLPLDRPCHDASHDDDKQDHAPDPAVAAHPATAPHAAVHHGAVLSPGGFRSQQRGCSDGKGIEALHGVS